MKTETPIPDRRHDDLSTRAVALRTPRNRLSDHGVGSIGRRILKAVTPGRIYLYLFIVFIYIPFFPILLLSFADQRYPSFPPTGFTLDWYLGIPPVYFDALFTSVTIAFSAMILATVLAAAAAIGLYYKPGRIGALIPTFLQSPNQVPSLVIGVVVLQFFVLITRSTGIVFVDTIPGLIMAHTVFCFPLAFGPIYSMLQRPGRALEEAAASLGASGWTIVRRVTLPSIQAALLAGALYAFVLSFSNVTVSMFLMQREVRVLPVMIMHIMEYDYQPYILSISGIVVAFSFLLVYLIHKLVGLDSMMKQNVDR